MGIVVAPVLMRPALSTLKPNCAVTVPWTT
jgi:hypothetical protein